MYNYAKSGTKNRGPLHYQAVGLEEPAVEIIEEKKFGFCGTGTKSIDGICTVVEIPNVKPWWQFW